MADDDYDYDYEKLFLRPLDAVARGQKVNMKVTLCRSKSDVNIEK